MATNKKETKNVTGLADATDRKAAEYNLAEALLKAAAFKTDDDNITEIEIERNGEFLFALHIHPISDEDITLANKKATKFKDHPQGKKYGKIQVGFDKAVYKSWLIYLATTPADQALIWGNPALKPLGVMEPWQAIDILLTAGDKLKLLDEVSEISGLDDDDDDDDEGEGKEEMDAETFQS